MSELVYKRRFLISIIILTLLAYIPLKSASYIYYDDPEYILENNYIKQLSFSNFFAIFQGNITVLYVPFTILSYLLEFSLFGPTPGHFHFVNLLLHTLNAILFYKLLLKFKIQNQTIIYILCLFFTLNPLLTESVCWISERKDVLYAAFFLLSAIQFLDFTTTKNKKSLFISWLLLLFSCLSKPMAVSLPVLMALYLFFDQKRLELKPFLVLIPFFVVSLIFSVISINSIELSEFSAGWAAEYSWLERFTIIFSELGYYFFKPFFPFHHQLLHLYPRPGTLFNETSLVFYCILGLGLVLSSVLFLSLNRDKMLLCLLLAWFFVLLPVLQIYPNTHSYVSERYFYMSLIFPPAIVIVIFNKYFQLSSKMNGSLIFLGLIFAFFTYKRSKDWQNTKTLFEHELKLNKNNFVALSNLGYYYNTQSQYSKAIPLLKSSVKINTGDPVNWNILGSSLIAVGQMDSAISCFRMSLKCNSEYIPALNNIGIAYMNKKQPPLALPYFKSAFRLDPENKETLYNFGAYYLTQGNKIKAMPFFQKALAKGNHHAERFLRP